MRFIVVIVVNSISLIVGSYALSLPLADVGMKPDYALGDSQVEEMELEKGGDYVYMDNSLNQGVDIMNDYKSSSLLIEEDDFASMNEEDDIIEELHQLDIDNQHSRYHNPHSGYHHPHNGGHYTLPVESDPTI
ncbi:hypothetical protein K501DRAFT_309179 [Backusella circina FSU 941]|nr:hypothetical protein K501DRAFT_309179 [Backusella circina FSU 941]